MEFQRLQESEVEDSTDHFSSPNVDSEHEGFTSDSSSVRVPQHRNAPQTATGELVDMISPGPAALNGNTAREDMATMEDICVPHEEMESGCDFEALEDLLSQLRETAQSPENGQNAETDFIQLRNRFKSVGQLRKNNTSAARATEWMQREPRFMFYSESIGSFRGEGLDGLDEAIRTKMASNTAGTSSASSSNLAKQAAPTDLVSAMKDGWFWIDVTCCTEAEMKILAKVFHIHPLTTEDLLTADTREKCEIFLHYYYLNIRTFDQNQYSLTYLSPINMGIVVFKDFILSFHSVPVTHPSSVLTRMSQLKLYGLRITPDWVNYAIIDDIVDSFAPVLRIIELEVDSIDDLVLILRESEQSDMLRRIGHARKKVMLLLRLLSTKADTLRTLIKRCSERHATEIGAWVSTDVSLYLGDIMDHAITMVQNLQHYEKTLSRSHSNYLAQISIELTQASNQTNDSVMKMTALASILVPLNVITGLWGMNIQVPGQYTAGFGWFFGILGFMAFISGTIYMWLKRHKLVGGDSSSTYEPPQTEELETPVKSNGLFWLRRQSSGTKPEEDDNDLIGRRRTSSTSGKKGSNKNAEKWANDLGV